MDNGAPTRPSDVLSTRNKQWLIVHFSNNINYNIGIYEYESRQL